MSLFQDFNVFLVQHSGTTGKASASLLSREPEKASSHFFTPVTSTGNFFKRVAYIATAPIFLSIVAAELAITTLIKALSAVASLITMDTDTAAEKGRDFLVYSVLTVACAFTAFVSPIINTVDLIGSLFTESTDKNREELRTANAPSI